MDARGGGAEGVSVKFGGGQQRSRQETTSPRQRQESRPTSQIMLLTQHLSNPELRPILSNHERSCSQQGRSTPQNKPHDVLSLPPAWCRNAVPESGSPPLCDPSQCTRYINKESNFSSCQTIQILARRLVLALASMQYPDVVGQDHGLDDHRKCRFEPVSAIEVREFYSSPW